MKQFYQRYGILMAIALSAVVVLGYLADWAITLRIKPNHLPFFALALLSMGFWMLVYERWLKR